MSKFKPGQSGNKAGRPKGTSQAAKLRQAIESDLPTIIMALAEAAKGGDVSAARLLLDKSMPNLKPTSIPEPVPGMTGATLSEQGKSILAGVANGTLSADNAQALLASLTSLSKIREVDELERRLTKLEEASKDDH